MVSQLDSSNPQVARTAAPSTAYDEFWEGPGVPRPHQRLLHAHLSGKSFQELALIQKAVRRRITEQEVTFNILGVPEGTNRPWQLDSVPLVLSRQDWTAVEAGLEQRAQIINLYLSDCFGPQRALKDGIVPAQLVLGHPSFPRACHGFIPLGAQYLWLYAADVGRAEDGAFRVYSDRTASPTGAGYALENRLVLGRALAELFRDYSVERVAGFFGKVRDCLASLAPRTSSQPRVVVLTAGAGDESSFEHAYLARYLGYELVEGRDLTVRERGVYLKTLSGLRRVDVVLRRVFDDLCDPLYLRPDSGQGVPGLVTSALYGQVGLANALGSVIAEAPALKAYLPALCRYYTGTDLTLEAVPTYWCGAAESLSYVLGHLDELYIKPAFSDRRGEPHRPNMMDQKARAALIARLKRRPADFVAERWPVLSVGPSLEGSAFAAGRIALRAFLCRSQDRYSVMPGGLARLDSDPDGIFLSLRSQAASKDVWIAGSANEADAPLPAMPDQRVELRRGGLDLPSRLLDDIFWLGRYVERSDVTSRLVRAGLERVGLEAGPDAPEGLSAILNVLRQLAAMSEPETSSGPGNGVSTAETLLLSALLSREGAGSLPGNLARIHQLTLSVRSRLSRDAWHVLRTLSTALDRVPREELRSGVAIDVLDRLLTVLAAVSGTMFDNMVRGHAWIFLDMGRRVERGALTIQLLQTLLPARASRVHMEALLEIADSLLTYRARYLSALQVAPVVDLLLTDATNPRSLAFQMEAIMRHVLDLPRPGDAVRSRAERSMIMLQSNLRTADVALACSGDGSGLRELLEDSHRLLWQFSDELTQTWFSHAESSKALSPPAWIDEELEAS
ncbi:MAG TPA: circularly permuted type 2 ATP-grasp protein [Polyangiaceae bacterium]